MICEFIKDLEKDNTKKPKSINFKQAAALLAAGERNVTTVMLEFLRSTAPVFEEFLTVLQTSGSTLHVVYDVMHLTLLNLMNICSGRSTERRTCLGTAICLMPRYQGSIS